MSARLVYLDSSGLVKRYMRERGSEHVDRVYGLSEAGDIRLAFSLWNMGEAIGVFDRYWSRGLISEEEFRTARSDIVSETLKLVRLGVLEVTPIGSDELIKAWSYVVKHHIYEADALQISSGNKVDCNLFLGADDRLLEAASTEGLNAINIESALNLDLQ